MHNGLRYTLTNEGLKEGDRVYPIANGRTLDGGGWILHGFDWRKSMSGFPDEPHTIKNTRHSGYKPYQVQTDHGYSPEECYYKIVKVERQVTTERPVGNLKFKDHKWVEIENPHS